MGTSSDILHVSGHTQSITATITGHGHTSDSDSRALDKLEMDLWCFAQYQKVSDTLHVSFAVSL